MRSLEAVATLRPRPFGPPLWGRTPLRDGLILGAVRRPSGLEKQGRRFHLKSAGPWLKIGGRRNVSAFQYTEVGLFADGFESGNTSAWSHTVP